MKGSFTNIKLVIKKGGNGTPWTSVDIGLIKTFYKEIIIKNTKVVSISRNFCGYAEIEIEPKRKKSLKLLKIFQMDFGQTFLCAKSEL